MKVLLVDLPEGERKKILGKKELPRFTEKTITDKEELEKELSKPNKMYLFGNTKEGGGKLF